MKDLCEKLSADGSVQVARISSLSRLFQRRMYIGICICKHNVWVIIQARISAGLKVTCSALLARLVFLQLAASSTILKLLPQTDGVVHVCSMSSDGILG